MDLIASGPEFTHLLFNSNVLVLYCHYCFIPFLLPVFLYRSVS